MSRFHSPPQGGGPAERFQPSFAPLTLQQSSSSNQSIAQRIGDRRITVILLSIVLIILYVVWQPNASLINHGATITVPLITNNNGAPQPVRPRAPLTTKMELPSYDTMKVAQGWQFADSDPDPKSVAGASQVRMVTSTRFWGNVVNDLERLKLFLDRALTYSDIIIIALRIEQDLTDTTSYIQENYGHLDGRVRVLPIRPWLVVTTPLNAVMVAASQLNAQYLCYQSIEVTATKEHIDMIMSEMDAQTMFAGAAIPNGHRFEEGLHALGGLTCPWNTLGIWDLKSLLRVGYSGISDRPPQFEFERGGLEEVATVAMLQLLARRYDAMHVQDDLVMPDGVKLVAMPPDLEWQVDFHSSPLRRERHIRKINAKQTHGEAILEAMGLKGFGTVRHVIPKALKQQQQKQQKQSKKKPAQQARINVRNNEQSNDAAADE